MNAKLRIRLATVAVTALAGFGQLTAVPAAADDELHNVTYLARVDGWSPGATVTFMTSDTQSSSTDVNQPFEAHAVLMESAMAGMAIHLQFPYSATVHCEIQVDDVVTAKSEQWVNTWVDNRDPHDSALTCGAPIRNAT